MQKEELLQLVKETQKFQCETQILEVKSANKGCPSRLYDTLSSFSNQDSGGILLFGLDETKNFDIAGVYDAHDLIQKVTEQCNQMMPTVRPLFTVAEISNKSIVSAEIPGVEIADRPVFYKGIGRLKGSYIRVGHADEPMSDYEIYSYDAYHRRIRDDLRQITSVDISHLDHKKLEEYLVQVKENKPNLSALTDHEILELLGVTINNIPTVAGYLMFSKYPQSYFPQLCVIAVVIPGMNMGDVGVEGERFLANKRIEGTIPQILEDSLLFVRRNMQVKTIIDKQGKRTDKYEYPMVAIREALLNALMHRDYSIHTEGTPVQVNMYKNRLEIINPGGLYGKLTIDSLGKIHADTRNQTLSNILEILKLAENRYSGIPTIKLEMEKHLLAPPVFESKRGKFSVTLFNHVRLHENQEIPSTNPSLKSILEYCRQERSRDELATFMGLTPYYTMKLYVMPLIEQGKLKMTIPTKPKSRYQRYITS